MPCHLPHPCGGPAATIINSSSLRPVSDPPHRTNRLNCHRPPLPLLRHRGLPFPMARPVSTPARSMAAAVAVAVAVLLAASPAALAVHDYADALHKSILFFEGQRSGRLPPRPAPPVAPGLGPPRRRRGRRGPDGRVLRRRRQRQVRVPDGVHGDAHVVGADRLRAQLRRARGGGGAGGRPVGDGLPDEGDGDARRGVRAGGRRVPRPRVLGAARGHGHPAHRVPGGRRAPGLRRGRRDRGRARRGVPGVPGRRPGVRGAAAGARRGGVRVRGRAPGRVQRQPPRRGVPLLLRLLRVPGRAAVGRGVAAPRVAPPGVPRVHQAQRGGARRQRRHQRVRLGQQARRHQRPHLQGGADGQGRVLPILPRERRQLHLRPPPRHLRRLRAPADPVLPRRPPLQGGQQQHAARDVALLPPPRLLQLPQPRRRPRLLRRRRLPRAAPPRGQAAGGLHPGRQPAAHVLHGGLRPAVPAPDPPPRQLAAVGGGAPGAHRVQGRRRLLRQPGAQPEPAGGRRRRRAQQQHRRLPRRARRVPAVRAHHLHQRAAARPARLLRRAPELGGGPARPRLRTAFRVGFCVWAVRWACLLDHPSSSRFRGSYISFGRFFLTHLPVFEIRATIYTVGSTHSNPHPLSHPRSLPCSGARHARRLLQPHARHCSSARARTAAELAGEEGCSLEKKRLQHFDLVLSTFCTFNFNIRVYSFQHFDSKMLNLIKKILS
ncbi:hypothetical protein PVAP13_4KG187900 [Panicum virgatum]|uniref:Uncharacterized protein n=1 Tax=Panicum virgatum TaxID=38727 RepID=A0A8T0TND3_PANVG|nr:hypothetical protein PVAP13_4KG187900 [Panicum virgatum]